MLSKTSQAFLALLTLALTTSSAVAAPVSKPVRSILEKRLPAYPHLFTGDGTVAQGWPGEDAWKTFDELWNINKAAYIDLSDNWQEETANIREGILAVSAATGVDERFILTTIIQESNGRVRVPSTANGVPNPGLMQSYGHITSGTCADVPTSQRCSKEMIYQMIRDGTASNGAGMGLADLIARAEVQDVSKYYKATRWYNSGINSVPQSGDLSSRPAGTYDYSSDIAHRLMGEVGV